MKLKDFTYFTLFMRELRRTINLRIGLIWIALAGMSIFFFYTTGGKTKLIERDQVEFIALFLPHMIFGSWAVLSSYFDLFSADREHKVLDCLLCSGITKSCIFVSKALVTMVMSLVLSLIYMFPVTCVIIGLSGSSMHLVVLLRYLLLLWGYIMVYAAMGVLVSVLARSSKSALIWSLAIGLLLMPRFFAMLVEGAGKAFGWSENTVDYVSLIAPGVMMQALSVVSDGTKFITAMTVFLVSIILFFGLAYFAFVHQDEYNYES